LHLIEEWERTKGGRTEHSKRAIVVYKREAARALWYKAYKKRRAREERVGGGKGLVWKGMLTEGRGRGGEGRKRRGGKEEGGRRANRTVGGKARIHGRGSNVHERSSEWVAVAAW
jgi:hypothetical protein